MDDTVIKARAVYGYDNFNRLASAQYSYTGGTVESFAYNYDRYGNRWSQSVTGGSGTQPNYSYNANNQIVGYTYDAAGNMIGDGTHTYTYDAEGNMTAVDGGNTAKYTYNAFNQRVRIDTGGTSAEFRFNLAGQRVSTWNGTTYAATRGQYYWGGMPIAYYNSSLHFQHQDWLGTARMQTGATGAVEGTYFSLPWDDGFNDNDGAAQFYGGGSSADDAYHFAGLDRDAETNTEHAQFRNYSSAQGRWLAPDPYDGSYDITNPQSLNRYAYALNNPLTFTDPSGLQAPGSGGGGDCANDPNCQPGGLGGLGGEPGFGGYGGSGGCDSWDASCGGGLFGDPWGGPPGFYLDGLAAVAEQNWLSSGSISSGGSPWYSIQGGNLMIQVGWMFDPNDSWDESISGDPTGSPIGTEVPWWLSTGSILGGYSESSYTFTPVGGGNSILSGGGARFRAGATSSGRPAGNIPFGQCMAGALISNFFGNDDLAGVTVALNVAALATKQSITSLLPGPGWAYTVAAVGYDGLMVAKSYTSCKTTGGFEVYSW